MLGSVTPSSFTRRSIVCRACTTASSRSRLRDVRPHAERVAAARAGAAIEVDRFLLGGLAERRLLRRRHPFDAERRHIDDRDGRGHAAALQLLLQPPAVLFRLHAQRIVGLDAQHEVHAALEVEPELQLHIAQPLRRRQVVARRENRIDADPEEHDEDDENGDELPA